MYVFIYLFSYLFIYLFIYSFIYLFIYLQHLGIQLTFTWNIVAWPGSPFAFTKKKQSVLNTCIFNAVTLFLFI